jgi:LEM-3-like GIY-YIG domain
VKKLRGNAKGQLPNLHRCYVYEIRVDGVVRYIGKGCNDRIYSHLIEARRTASRSEVKIRNLSPHFRKMLVSAVRRGAIITEKIISSKLTDAEAYAMEWQMIWDYHKRHAGQLWNTIDERGRNPEDLPKQWSNPVFPLYRLPRPFNKPPDRSIAPIEPKTRPGA